MSSKVKADMSRRTSFLLQRLKLSWYLGGMVIAWGMYVMLWTMFGLVSKNLRAHLQSSYLHDHTTKFSWIGSFTDATRSC